MLKAESASIPGTRDEVLDLCKPIEIRLTVRKVLTNRDPEFDECKHNKNSIVEEVFNPLFKVHHYMHGQLPPGLGVLVRHGPFPVGVSLSKL